MSITNRFNSDRLATWMVIVLCSVATFWLGQDMIAGGDSGARSAGTGSGAGQPAGRGGRPAPPLPAQPLSISDAVVKGSERAKVVLIAFSDFECPYCSRFAKDTLPVLDEKYVRTGRVRVAFRHLPIESIHPTAFKAAEASECAREQGRFWEMHDRLFDQFKQLSQPKT